MILRTVYCRRSIFPDVLHPVGHIRSERSVSTARVKRIDSVTEPVFTLHVNGCDRQGQEAFGESWGMIKESDIPNFLMEVGKTVQQENTVFATWYEKTPKKLKRDC